MSSSKYFCRIDGQDYGPFSGAELRGLVREQRLHADDMIQKSGGRWVPAGQLRGLFDGDAGEPAEPQAAAAPPPTAYRHVPEDGAGYGIAPEPAPARTRKGRRAGNPAWAAIDNVNDCVSAEERRQRLGVRVASLLVWALLLLAASAPLLGLISARPGEVVPHLISMAVVGMMVLLPIAIRYLAGEYYLRRVQAAGVTASPKHFPEIHSAVAELSERFGIPAPPAVVLNSGELNAMAFRFGRRKAVALFTETLEGTIDRPGELRFIIGHELGHVMLDFGRRRFLELYRPAAFSAARELSCDNVGLACSGSLDDAKRALRRLVGGNRLHERLDDAELIAEAQRLRSGFWGWLLRRNSAYPPIGTRIANLDDFAGA